MKTKLFTALIASSFLVVGAHAQIASQSQGQYPNANSGANGNANSNSNMNKQPDIDSLIHQGHAGTYYGGTVKVASGALPWDPILVNVVCNGDTRYTTATDPKGNFLISPKPGDPAANTNNAASGGDAQNKFAAQYVG